MADLIDRQAAIDAIESHIRVGDELYHLSEADRIKNYCFEVAASCVYNLPSADAVEVVRCRDCKYSDFGECKHKLGLIVANDENYCSYGVRKDDEHQ